MDHRTKAIVEELEALAKLQVAEAEARGLFGYEGYPLELDDMVEHRAAKAIRGLSVQIVEQVEREETDREKELLAKISELEKRLAAAHPWRNQLVMIPRKMPQDFKPERIAGNIENALDFSQCSDEFTLGARSAIAEIARYLTENRKKVAESYRNDFGREDAGMRALIEAIPDADD